MSDIDERVQAAVLAYFANIQDTASLETLALQDVTHQVFLSLSDPNDINDHNARRTYLELIATPAFEDVVEYCLIWLLLGWRSRSDGRFAAKNEQADGEEFLRLEGPSYTGNSLRAYFLKQVRRVMSNVEIFGNFGLFTVIETLQNEGKSDEQIVDKILEIRARWGIPTKDDVEQDDSGRILKFVFSWPEEVDQRIVEVITGVDLPIE
ncbi:hypothetical protein GALMADRAFT_217296 [Galerina marginata CBS 339.88]|uniref:Uncharacterized protein n=1 Tax=Galerina marginata (strain CBS 339.88) TaxID=685588 RepID=A0A067S4Y1_GALM3|nr:hypothetical protein GALMADRAFT_217296 [Galerina marginata CBS 339.88]